MVPLQMGNQGWEGWTGAAPSAAGEGKGCVSLLSCRKLGRCAAAGHGLGGTCAAGCGAAEESVSCRRQNGGEHAEPQPYRGKEVGGAACGAGGRKGRALLQGWGAGSMGGCVLRVRLGKYSELKVASYRIQCLK